MKSKDLYCEKWSKLANSDLKGKKIKEVKWTSNKDMEEFLWSSRAIQIHFTDGTFIEAWRDDEGNDAGALAYYCYKDKSCKVFPVI